MSVVVTDWTGMADAMPEARLNSNAVIGIMASVSLFNLFLDKSQSVLYRRSVCSPSSRSLLSKEQIMCLRKYFFIISVLSN